jgi:CoA:oxalate CoA-transferase
LSTNSVPGKILDGIKVVDFTWQVMGPLVGSALAGFGAEVIKVESLTSVEMSRRMPPFAGGVSKPDNAFQFNVLNTGKMGITLNLNHPQGPEIAKRLISRADIVTENFLGGRMVKWGLGYEDLTG